MTEVHVQHRPTESFRLDLVERIVGRLRPWSGSRDDTGPTARLRRRLQLALGAVWLLDAALQYQPFMFGRAFAAQVIEPTAEGNPGAVARPVLWAAHVVLAHPALWNGLFATVQLLLALGLFWRRTVKLTLAGSVIWSLLVWWLAEGLGGVLADTSPLMGAPGAVILYALLALLLWPSEREEGSVAASGPLRRGAAAAWVVLWASAGYLALLPANTSAHALHDRLAGMADGEPAWLASLDRWSAGLAAGHGTALALTFGALLAAAALAPVVPPLLARPLLALALLLAALIWVFGQNLGGILTGQGTDPNSAPLLALLALAYWPLSRTRREEATPPRRLVLAALAVAATAAAALAAVTTSTPAPAAAAATPASATTSRNIGPGAVFAAYQLGPYKVIVRDDPNRASKAGTIAVALSRAGRPVSGARVKISFNSLEMDMGTLSGVLPATAPGHYGKPGPVLGMSGRWRIRLEIRPPHAHTLRVTLVDQIAQ